MKKSKLILGLAAIMLVFGAIFFALETQTAKAQAHLEENNGDEEPCGICVTPTSSYPYPDDFSDATASNCSAC